MINFSVIICTYNGASRIPRVLERLQQQTAIAALAWEVIVVDNNSSDQTAEVFRQCQANWRLNSRLRYCFESRQGLAYARRCGVHNAQGSVLAFLDDDNLPHTTWLAELAAFSNRHPRAGAYGGPVYGEFEVPPPKGFERIARFFALVQGDVPYCYNEKYSKAGIKMFPPGAGIIIRKEAWQSSIKRSPTLPQTGEDLEMLLQIWQAGWEIWFVPSIKIDHHIPASRFEQTYLTQFFHKNGLVRYPYRMLQYRAWQKPLLTVLYILNDLKKLTVFTLINQGQETDLIYQCEQRFLLSTLLSPAYHLWDIIKKMTFFRKLPKLIGFTLRVMVTDKLKSNGAAKRQLLEDVEHGQHKGANNRVANSRRPTQVKKRRMERFKFPGGC
ncbi:MAG: hormogonium polysaccharide biosynthesis glycosyltransferase HpsE [Cyanobacteria bacterium P01_H01_bin.58]